MKLEKRYIPFSIELNGVRWSADWSLEGKDDLVIRSAYGSARRAVGRRKPYNLARELLVEILAAKLAACEGRRPSA